MTKSIFKTIMLSILLITFSSCDDDDNSPSRSADKIEFIIDNGTPISYSTNIITSDTPLAPTSGYNCIFKINSENTVGDTFELSFGFSTMPCPFQLTTPSTIGLSGAQISVLNIQGIDINYSSPGNAITLDYQLFGQNSGDDIKIIISGNYYDSLGQIHTINGDIDIVRS